MNEEHEETAKDVVLSHTDFLSIFKNGFTYLMQKAKESLDSPNDLVRFLRYPSAPIQPGPITYLGITYPSPTDISFLDDFQTRIWMTYRSDFPPVKAHSYTSDSGWGCMLRSGQMLLANAMLYAEFGRGLILHSVHLDSFDVSCLDWKIEMIEKGDWLAYANLVLKFLDSPTAPYSIHRIALQGAQFDKDVGHWFGPSTISQVLKVLNQGDRTPSLRIHVSQDGILYTNEVVAAFQNSKGESKPVLLLVPILLGLDNLNPLYFPLIRKCFDIKSCVGIAGGRPNSSLFFTGYQGDNLIYYDPHFIRPALPLRDINSYKRQDLFSYHCDKVRFLRISSLDPSMVLGFLVKDQNEFQMFCTDVKELISGATPLFGIHKDSLETQRADLDLLSDDE